MNQRILVILPHPDDEAFGLAGTLAKRVDEGYQVTYACLTLGEMGRNMGNPPFANRVTLPQIRKLELEESARAIGIQDLRMLGFHDKTIEFEDQERLDGVIRGLLEELQPSLVVTFYPGYSVHPDHDATGAAVIRTIQGLPAEQRPVVHCLAFSKNCQQVLGPPDVTDDVNDYLEPKMKSIQAHRSQFQIAEMLGGKNPTHEEIQARFGTEHFWTYKFDV
ncbi:bacillithiol biosynthesis deacetylase BshB2 [Paenibacillus sp. P96]|uniref:Bacillithiol biosynthesis deacetylase BshB2 n=1 Tax=Paenibacillus zeirhizosphaerae TaxID=2987519 RepID=A0ABT9FU64_9BACL|nr:bacillithiol biosynthesis deacetylase BshB2 [Paenibacillus sp. P96]MDP4098007.1 bacillithiol biosynthesis deacetylase BshB2 [Paenibacillus sp. P96]